MSEQKRPYKPKHITPADCPIYLQSQGKKWSPYITPDQYPCKECPSSDCKERKQRRLDRPELRDILERYGAFIEGNDMTDDYLDIDEALEAILALIPDIDYLTNQLKLADKNYLDLKNAFDEQVEEAKKQERERFNEAVVLVADVAGLAQEIFTDVTLLGLANRAEEILQALKEENG